MKIAWMSCAPFQKNAYARCGAEICYRLLGGGHEVDYYASFGMEQATIDWPLGRDTGKEEHMIKVVGNPVVGQQHGDWHPGLAQVAQNYDLIIAHCDLWNQWQKLQRLRGSRWVNYVVGDHSPVPAPHRMLFNCPVFAKGVPMTKWFEDELRRCPQIDPDKVAPAIYHGHDPEVFYPSPNPKIDVPDNCDFFIITVADNTGHRENLPEMIEGYSIFLKETGANAYYYIHAFPQSASGGYNLPNVCAICEEMYGVKLWGKIGFKQQQVMPDSFMRDLYSRADCQLMCIQGGSFEIPLIEAGACGCPNISTDFSAPPELLGHGERGLLVPPVAPYWANLTSSRQMIVNPRDIAKALATYYYDRKLRRKHARRMREWVEKNATWDIIGQQWLNFLDELEGEVRGYGKAYFAIRNGLGYAGEDELIRRRVSGKILEVGCGLGDLLARLSQDGCDAEGVDVSEYAVEVCKQKGLKARVANAENLPFEDNSMDFVCSEHLLEHCDDHMGALRESLRVAKKGVVHIVPGHTGRDLTHRRYFTKEMMEEMCRKLDAPDAEFWRVDGAQDWVLEVLKGPSGKKSGGCEWPSGT